MKLIVCAVLLVPCLAAAAPSKKDLEYLFEGAGGDVEQYGAAIQWGFDSTHLHAAPKTWREADPDVADLVALVDPTIAQSGDGTAAWVAVRVKRAMQCAGLTGTLAQCEDDKAMPPVNTLVVLDKAGKTWIPVAVHSAVPLTDKELAKAVAGGRKLDAITKRVGAGAEDAAKLFETSFADPKQLAASVSDRKDVVLFGSAPNEKTVGGKKVATTLTSWKLAFTVHDGIAAGITSSKTVAWVAANVDARPVGKADAKPTPYRVLCIYEKTKTAWQLVALEFSYPA